VSAFVTVGRVADFPEGEGRKVVVDGRDVAVFRLDGELHALDNHCLHRGGPLCEGFIARGAVTCPWHGWSFDIRTGTMLQDPRVGVTHHEIRVEGEEVAVRLES
jgi:NAD(P)H-dependent nitrite reductase small subunit